MTEGTSLARTLDEPAPLLVSTVDAGNGPAVGKNAIFGLPDQVQLPHTALQGVVTHFRHFLRRS